MRTDVKLGIAISAAVVTVAGGYFLFRDTGGNAVPINGTATTSPTDATALKTATPTGAMENGRTIKGKQNPQTNPGQAPDRRASGSRETVVAN